MNILLLTIIAFVFPIIQSKPDRGKCNIDIMPNLTPKLFYDNYYLQKPVIIPINPSIRTKKMWSLNTLARKYSKTLVKTGDSNTLTKNRGSGQTTMTLKKFIKELRRSVNPTSPSSFNQNKEIFAFERNPILFNRAPELIKSANAIGARFLKIINRTNSTLSDWYISIGNKNAGVHAHHHLDGWTYMFQGSKRWFFWPPFGSLPAFTHVARFPIKEWYYKFVYPKLQNEEMPIECAVLQNDFLYVPEGHWHATINLSPIVVAIASQLRVPATKKGRTWRYEISIIFLFIIMSMSNTYLLTTFYFFITSHQRDAVDFWGSSKHIEKTIKRLERIQKEQNTNAEAFHFGGVVMARKNKGTASWEMIRKELKMKQRAYELSPRNCDVLHNYAVSLAKNRQIEKAEEILRKAIELCGEFQPHLRTTLEVIQKLEL